MSLKDLVETYLYKQNVTRRGLAKKADVDVSTLRSFMDGRDIGISSFKKIVQAVDYEIHLKPRNTSTTDNGGGTSQSKAESVSQNK